MRIIGIDPGVAITGYGIVEEINNQYHCVESGCITTSKDLAEHLRLVSIYEQLEVLLTSYQPQVLAIEKLFFSKNVSTAFQVGEARGVIILAAAVKGLEIFQYTPLQVKQAVAGYGKAEKAQVQTMVQLLLKLPKRPAVDDEADALAVAICYLQSKNFQNAIKGGGKQ